MVPSICIWQLLIITLSTHLSGRQILSVRSKINIGLKIMRQLLIGSKASLSWQEPKMDQILMAQSSKSCMAQELNFENITSQPHYPHYNGFIKAKSVKSALLKSNLTKLSQTLTCCFFVWEVPMVIINSPHLPSHYCGVQSKKTCQGRFQGTHQMKTWPSG